MPTIKRSILLPLILTVCVAAQVIVQSQVEIIPDLIYGHKGGLAMTFDALKPQANANGAAKSKNDYSKADTWLCRPGREDACSADLTTTIVAANGKLTEEKWKANPKR
jgi:hypothetical protein